MRKCFLVSAFFGLISVHSFAKVVFEDDFSDGLHDWALRASSSAIVVFEPGKLELTLGPDCSQPLSAFRSFNPIALADGDRLQLLVYVSSLNSDRRSRDLRIAIGFADPLIRNPPTGNLNIPMAGYYTTAPSGGSTSNPEVRRTGFESGVNFFNTNENLIGIMRNNQSVPIDGTAIPWVFEIIRVGDELIFSGSLNGVQFSNSIFASGADIIDDFTFNTAGISHGFSAGESAFYHKAVLRFFSGN